MIDKDQQILDAAIAVFSRYGVRKATMGDIAEQAGISRQTLYARYANKGVIMKAAMALITERVVEQVTQAWQTAESIGDRLDIFLDIAVIRFFEQIRQMPDSSDLMTGHVEGGAAPHQVADAGKIELLTDLFSTHTEALAVHGSSPRALAEFFYQSSASFKFTARDLDHLAMLLSTLKATTLMMLGES